MKNCLKLILIITLSFTLFGCTLNKAQYIQSRNKLNDHFYTSEIYTNIKNNEKYTIKIFDLDIYKYYEVPEKEHSILPEFIEFLNKESYSQEIDTSIKPRYRVFIEFKNSTYLIDAYNEDLISIYPWDGVLTEDKITMKDVPDYYNIYKFCEYIEKVSRGFEG